MKYSTLLILLLKRKICKILFPPYAKIKIYMCKIKDTRNYYFDLCQLLLFNFYIINKKIKDKLKFSKVSKGRIW